MSDKPVPHSGVLPLFFQQPSTTFSKRSLKISIVCIVLFCLLLWASSRDGDREPPTDLLHDGPGVLLVSAYFPLPVSKHSQGEYNAWLSYFLTNVTTDVYFFTTEEMAPTIKAIRGDLPIFINTHYKSPWEIEPLHGRKEQMQAMHSIDREAWVHVPDLYAVWAAKPFFVNEAIHHIDDLYFRHAERPPSGFLSSNTRSRYKYVFWSDSGSWRSPYLFKQWPYVPRLDEVWKEGSRLSGTPEKDLVFIPIEHGPPRMSESTPSFDAGTWKDSMGPLDLGMAEGSFFGGHPEAMRWWYRAYFTYFSYWADKGLFVGKDQTVMNALMFLFRDRIINVWHEDRLAPERRHGSLGHCGDMWFYYIYWLGAPHEKYEQAKEWNRGRTPDYRSTGVRVNKYVLERTFGVGWEGPTPSLPLIADTRY